MCNTNTNRRSGAGDSSDTLAFLRAKFLTALEEVADKLHMHVRKPDEFRQNHAYLQFSDSFPMWIVVEFHEEDDCAFLYGVVRTSGLPGDRSDYHDLISSLWAICIRMLNVASVRMVDIPHPVAKWEMHGRFILFD